MKRVILRLKYTYTLKIGLIASSTPFVTGRPVTLFHNANVHSSGAVGIALTGGGIPRSSIEFPGLKSITPPLIVTRSAEMGGFCLFEIN
jgi:small ligand-binding sensory domain FIST